jgi:hypothetical protein
MQKSVAQYGTTEHMRKKKLSAKNYLMGDVGHSNLASENF